MWNCNSMFKCELIFYWRMFLILPLHVFEGDKKEKFSNVSEWGWNTGWLKLTAAHLIILMHFIFVRCSWIVSPINQPNMSWRVQRSSQIKLSTSYIVLYFYSTAHFPSPHNFILHSAKVIQSARATMWKISGESSDPINLAFNKTRLVSGGKSKLS